jgi:hypothetical protein
MSDHAELPPIPSFDERAVRRAIWRGVARTAVTAALLLLVALTVLDLVSAAWQTRGDREERFRLVGVGLQVANPGLHFDGPFCCNTELRGMELVVSASPRTARAESEITTFRPSVTLRGRVEPHSVYPLPPAPATQVLDARPSPGGTRGLLQRLPDAVVATAVVELARPLRHREWEAFLERRGRRLSPQFLDVPPVFLEPLYTDKRRDFPPRTAIGWPEPISVRLDPDELEHGGLRDITAADDDSLPQFQRWVRMLRDGDDSNLRRVGLPSLERLRALARSPRVHGFILERATLAELRSYLDDPAVRSIAVADVAFDLTVNE